MKAPKMPAKDGKAHKERSQGGKGRASGVNKPAVKESVPQVVARETYGKPTQKQRM